MQRLDITGALAGGVLVAVFGFAALLQQPAEYGQALPASIILSDTVTDGSTTYVPVSTTTYTTATYDTTSTATTNVTTNTSTTTTTTTGTTDTTTTSGTTYTTTTTIQTPAYVTCPFTPGTDFFVADFTRGGTWPIRELMVRANGTATDARRSFPYPLLPPGIYEVRLASFDWHTAAESPAEYFEMWRLDLLDSAGGLIASSYPTRDLTDSDKLIAERVGITIAVNRSSAQAVGVHHAYPNTVANTVAPICAAFKRVGDLTTTTVNTTGTATTTSTTAYTTTYTTTVPNTTYTTPTTTEYTATVPVTTTATTTTTTAVATTTSLFQGMYRTCPMAPRTDRVIVDFTKGGTVSLDKLVLRANGLKADAVRGPLYMTLPAGTYDVQLASFGGSVSKDVWDREMWLAQLFDSAGVLVAQTPPSRDVPEWDDDFVSRVSEQFTVKTGAVRMLAVHAAYPQAAAESFAVLCASFDKILTTAPVVSTTTATYPATQTTTPIAPPPSVSVTYPSPTPAPTPTPTYPVPVGATSVTVGTAPPAPSATQIPVSPPASALPMVEVPPQDVGLVTALREVKVAEPIVEARRDVLTEMREQPFTYLQQAGTTERQRIAERLFEASRSASSTGTATSSVPVERPPIRLDRVSEESARPTVAEDTPQRTEQTERIVERSGLAAIRDVDGDGITDYDELHLYGTDPDNPFTAGSVLTDGERLLLGLNPAATSTESVVVESPKVAGEAVPDLFTVDAIELARATSSVAGQASAPAATSSVRITGTTKPFAFVTLYVYSTPIIVTVRADINGRFEYTLDRSLEDGSHELYVASVNNTGKVLAKSDPIPFVKTAQAVEYTPASAAAADPVSGGIQQMITFGLLLLLVLAIGGMVLIGAMKAKHPETEIAAPDDTHAGV